MPRGDGGWYPIALDCAPFRFPQPSSKTKSHSTFPIENDTWLVTKFREVFLGTWCFFFFAFICWDLKGFCPCWDLKVFLCEVFCVGLPRTLCISTRSMMPWRTEKLSWWYQLQRTTKGFLHLHIVHQLRIICRFFLQKTQNLLKSTSTN